MKNPWLAAALAFFLFPFSAGYIYLKEWRSAIFWFVIIWSVMAFQKGVLLTIVVLITIWDCYSSAKKYNLRVQELVKKLKEKKQAAIIEKRIEKRKKIAEAKIEAFEAKQTTKGLVKFNGKWGTPEQVEKWKEIEIGLDKNFAHLSHFEFENFIGELFEKMGYETTVTRKTGDFGIDVIAKKSNDTIAIQVKKNSSGNHVGAVTVQNVLGSMWQYKANKAIIITTSDFTVQAEQQAREAPVELWNKRILHEMVRKHLIDGNNLQRVVATSANP